MYCGMDHQKRLRKVWQSAHRRALGFTREQTIIIEDTPSNCSRNYGNALYVHSFRAGNSEKDDLYAAAVLTRYLAHLQRSAPLDVRRIEKRGRGEPRRSM